MNGRQRSLERLDTFVGEVASAKNFATWLSIPDTHIGVLFQRLQDFQRKSVVEEAHRVYCRANASECSVIQLIAFALFVRGYHASRYTHLCKISNPTDAELVSLDKLTVNESSRLLEVFSGQSATGCAKIFYTARDSVLRSSEQEHLDLGTLLRLQDNITTPSQAAALISISSTLESLGKQCDRQIDNLLGESEELNSSYGIYKAHKSTIEQATTQLIDIAGKTRESRNQVFTLQRKLLQPEELSGKFQLDAPTGLFLPEPQRIILATSLNKSLKEAINSPAYLHQLSPRKFEEFARDLFVRLGYEVELTHSTRDGGADLLCLRSLHGISVRFAVELKRYKADRPINVSLVRSFVGSNQQHKAHKLIYVTTSYYTQPAVSYATNYASHLLDLRKYEHIREWCHEALRTQ